MDLKKVLLSVHSKPVCNKIVDYVGNDQKRFAELMQLFFEGEYRVTQRAAWPISYCVRNHPELAKPYFRKLINLLTKPGLHDAVNRNIVRLLQDVEIPARFHGQLMTICFDFIKNVDTPIAVKAFSLRILENFTKQYPEIIPELKEIIEDRWPYETAAFKSRAKRILQSRN